MLFPIEAFLLNYDDWPTVIKHGHARVVTLAGDTKDFHAVAVAAEQDGLSTVPRITTACDRSSSTSDGAALPLGSHELMIPLDRFSKDRATSAMWSIVTPGTVA